MTKKGEQFLVFWGNTNFTTLQGGGEYFRTLYTFV